MQPGASLDFGAVIASMLPMLFFMVAIYALFAACLMVIARKTGTPGAGMAWIPVANLLLMCRIARKPGWWLILFLIPFVNLVIGVVVWMGIARARGKSPGLIFLMFVPLVGLVVPVILASGEPTHGTTAQGPGASGGPGAAGPARGASGTPGAAGPAPGPATSSASPPQPAVCPGCQTPVHGGDAFCGECGTPLGAPPPAAEPTTTGAGPLVMAVLGLVAVGAAGWWLLSGGPGELAPPSLPQRAAGAIREFPVDTGDTPAQPTSVIRRNLADGGGESGQQIPDAWLPPGLPAADLPGTAEAITSASYRTTPDAPVVPVHVLETAPGDDQVARRVARNVAEASGSTAQTTGVQVTSPDGDVYEGFRVQTPQQEVYALQHTRQPIVIIIYAPQPAAFPVAARLAQNVSNGEGLPDYPVYRQTLGVLPIQPPAGFVLDEMTTVLPEDLGLTREQLLADIGADASPEVEELIGWLEQFIPQRITTARYRDAGQRIFDVVSGDYGGTIRAMTTWLALRALGAGGGLESIDSAGGTALWTESGDGPLLFLRAGHNLIAVGGPPGSAPQELAQLAGSMQAVAGR